MKTCPQCKLINDDIALTCDCGFDFDKKQTTFQYAPLWKRLIAAFVDILPFAVVLGQLSRFAPNRMLFNQVSWALLGWLYFALMESSKYQATLGKKLFSIYVADSNRQRLSFGRASGRFFAKYLCCAFVGIGFLVALFTRKKQGLHDLIADSVVLTKLDVEQQMR